MGLGCHRFADETSRNEARSLTYVGRGLLRFLGMALAIGGRPAVAESYWPAGVVRLAPLLLPLAVFGAALATTAPWGSVGGPLDPSGMSFNLIVDRQAVDCRSSMVGKTVVIVSLGQSLMGNSGDPKGRSVPESGVFNFNWIDGKCYIAKDPLLGTTTAGANQLTRIAELLVKQSAYDSVMLVPLAHGGTFIKQWAPGGDMNPRLTSGLQRSVAAGLIPNMILWEQGEAEAGNPPQPPNGKAWADLFNAMVISIRDIQVISPIYVARSTICRNDGSTIIRSAQADVVNNFDVLAGPDTDTIPLSDRWDGCHFGVSGLDKAARLWLATLKR
jgi:Carbohydrate esterase, sialic acid-specific acetylesterase